MTTPAQNLPPVQQHLWRDYSLPRFSRIVLTLTTPEGIGCFAVFALCLTLVQDRCWTIIKSMLPRILRPVQMPLNAEDPNPEPFKKISQTRAIIALFRSLYNIISRKHDLPDDGTMTPIPWQFGAVAVANLAVYFALGIFIPYCLTGGLGSAVVQSKLTDYCLGYEDSSSSKRYTAQLADSYFKQCLMNTSGISPSCSQESGIVGHIPFLSMERLDTCPFPGDVCQTGVQPVRLEYTDLGSRDFGVNLDRRPLLSHRVTCSPIETDQFLIPTINSSSDPAMGNTKTIIWFGRKYHDSTYNGSSSAIYGAILNTRNGPNRYSDDFSGNTMASYLEPQSIDVQVFPYGEPTDRSYEIHPSLQRDDGLVSVIMFRAGRSLFGSPIDDPLYSAHHRLDAMYVPDYEATALGCVEQYKMCMHDKSFCTSWGDRTDVSVQLMTWGVVNGTWRQPGSQDLAYDLLFIYSFFTIFGSMDWYLDIRTGPQILLTNALRIRDEIQYLDEKQQWIREVEALFITAFLNARYSLLQVVRRKGPKRGNDTAEHMLTLCRTTLFRSSDYTNVNFIGLVATILALLLIYAWSHEEKIGPVLKKFATNSVNFLISLPGRVKSLYGRVSTRAKQILQTTFGRRQRRSGFPLTRTWRRNGGPPQVFSTSNDELELPDLNGVAAGSDI